MSGSFDSAKRDIDTGKYRSIFAVEEDALGAVKDNFLARLRSNEYDPFTYLAMKCMKVSSALLK